MDGGLTIPAEKNTDIDLLLDLYPGGCMGLLYDNSGEMMDLLVPYFRECLDNNEFCTWVLSEDKNVEKVKKTLMDYGIDVDGYLRSGQLYILSNETFSGFYEKDMRESKFKKLEINGFSGLKIVRDGFLPQDRSDNDLLISMGENGITSISTYPLDQLSASGLLDLMELHEDIVVKKDGFWTLLNDYNDQKISPERHTGHDLERNIPYISSMLIDPLNIDNAIELCLEEIGTIIDASRTYVFQLIDGGTIIDKTHEWFMEGLGSRKENITYIPVDVFTRWMDMLENEGFIHISDVSSLSSEMAEEKYIFESKGINSFLGVPISMGDQITGLIGVENAPNIGEWDKYHTSVLSMVSNMLGMALNRKYTRNSLMESEKKYRMIFENSPLGIFHFDSNGIITDCNDRVLKIFGAPMDEIAGFSIESFFADTDMRQDLRDALSGRSGHYGGEYFSITSNKVSSIKADYSSIRSEDGRVMGGICIIEDITHQNLLMDELKESEKNYRRLFEFSSDAHILFDEDRIYDCNEEALKIFGFAEKEALIGSNPLILSPSCQMDGSDSIKSHFCLLKDAFKNGYSKFEWTHCRNNGESFPAEVWLRSFTLKGKRVLQSTIRDITARKDAEETLLKAKELAEAGNRTKNDFLANMSHELRTPLNSVIGFSDILLGKNFGDLNPKQEKYVSNISTSGKHLLEIINSILDLSKVEAGKMELNYMEFPLTHAILEVKSVLASMSSKKKIEIVSTVDSSLFTIEADASKFKQILYNLVSNALKFTQEGGKVSINASLVGDMAMIDVIDTGIGMSREDMKNVFKPFVQLDSSASRHYDGTGLGLAIVDRFAKLHGGDVFVSSEPGKGSTFTFTIPVKRQEISDMLL